MWWSFYIWTPARTSLLLPILGLAFIQEVWSFERNSVNSSTSSKGSHNYLRYSSSHLQRQDAKGGMEFKASSAETRNLEPLDGTFVITQDGIPIDSEGPLSYGRFQDNETTPGTVIISPGRSSVTLKGNAWKAFKFPSSRMINENTVLEFDFTLEQYGEAHLICLDTAVDSDLRNNYGDWNVKYCFLLGVSAPEQWDETCYGQERSWFEEYTCTWLMQAVPELIEDGNDQPTHVQIDVGHFSSFSLRGFEVRYLGLISDNDVDPSVGQSTYGNITLYDDSNAPRLSVTVSSSQMILDAPESYGRYQDFNRRDPYAISENGSQITLFGNAWKALKLNAPYTINENTVLEFDFTLEQYGEAHLICLDTAVDSDLRNNYGDWNVKYCFLLGVSAPEQWDETCYGQERSWFEEYTCTWLMQAVPELIEGGNDQPSHVRIDVGHFSSLSLRGFEVRYLGLISDNDVYPSVGQSTYGNITLYDDSSAPRLSVTVSSSQMILDAPESYGRYQDFNRRDPYAISENGSQITLFGNAWKALKLNASYTINENTVLEFDFTLKQYGEAHLICLDTAVDSDLRNNYGDWNVKYCFLLGVSAPEQWDETCYGQERSWFEEYTCTWLMQAVPELIEGGNDQPTRVRIDVGHFSSFSLRGFEVRYLGLISDNDVDPSVGQSTYGNITLYDDSSAPRLIMTVNNSEMTLGAPESYGRYQDFNRRDPYVISEVGSEITLFGNAWKALKLNASHTINENTVLEFDFTLKQYGEAHLICLDTAVDSDLRNNYGDWNVKYCFLLGVSAPEQWDETCYGQERSWFEEYTCTWLMQAVPELIEDGNDQPTRVRIDVGHFSSFSLRGFEVRYLGLISDNDVDPSVGQSTYGNITLYDDSSAPRLIMTVSNSEMILGAPESYGRYQDFNRRDPYAISEDGSGITLFGNAWKATKLTEIYTINANTVVEFDFVVTYEAEGHLICFDTLVDSLWGVASRCVRVAGTMYEDTCYTDGTFWGDTCIWEDQLQPFGSSTYEIGVEQHYILHLGQQLRGLVGLEIQYIAFVSDNDENVDVGESRFKNLQMYDACSPVYSGEGCPINCGLENCPTGYCSPNNICISDCAPDWYGTTCSTYCGADNCDGSCGTDGSCCALKCQNGGKLVGSGATCECHCDVPWTGSICTECVDRYFGEDCGVYCGPDTCDGTCKEEDGTCEPNIIVPACGLNCQNGGTLVGTGLTCRCDCELPWAGANCTQCADHYYGEDCGTECSPDTCDGTCKEDGTCEQNIIVPACRLNCQNGGTLVGTGETCQCDCELPWAGANCTNCADHYYGENCGTECSPDTCNGECKDDGTCKNLTPVIAGATAGVAAALVGVVCVMQYFEWSMAGLGCLEYCWKARRALSNSKKDESTHGGSAGSPMSQTHISIHLHNKDGVSTVTAGDGLPDDAPTSSSNGGPASSASDDDSAYDSESDNDSAYDWRAGKK